MLRRAGHVVWEALRRYFVAGVLALAPILVTVWAVVWIIGQLDNLLLPHVLKLVLPSLEEPPRLPVIGALFTLLAIIGVGFVVRHFFGGELVRAGERLLGRVPVARNIYNAVKQLLEAIFTSDQHASFRRVIMIEYPRKGLYALAFTTGPARGVLQDMTRQRVINCFVPTTPNPTSGFYLLIPEEEVIEVSLSVEDAFKIVMSAGLVSPETLPLRKPPSGAEAPAGGGVPVPAAGPSRGPL